MTRKIGKGKGAAFSSLQFPFTSYNHISGFLHVTHSARLLPCVVLFRVLLASGRVLEQALQEVFGSCSQHSFSEAVLLRREGSPLTLQALKQPRSSSESECRGEGRKERSVCSTGCCYCGGYRGMPAGGGDRQDRRSNSFPSLSLDAQLMYMKSRAT